MLSSHQVPAHIEQIADGGMGSDESLSLPGRLELSHPPLPHSGRFMRLLSLIILILLSAVDRSGYQFTMGYVIAPKLIGNDLPWFTSIDSDEDFINVEGVTVAWVLSFESSSV